MMDYASIHLQCDPSDLSSLSDGNDNNGGRLSTLVPSVNTIPLKGAEAVVEETEHALEDPEVVVVGYESLRKDAHMRSNGTCNPDIDHAKVFEDLLFPHKK